MTFLFILTFLFFINLIWIKVFFIIIFRIFFLWTILLHRTNNILTFLVALIFTWIIFVFRWRFYATWLNLTTGTWSLCLWSSIGRSILSTSSIRLWDWLFCHIIFFIFYIKLFVICWVLNFNFNFVLDSPDLNCLIITARCKHIGLVWWSIDCVYQITMTTISIVLNSASGYFMKKLTCISSPNVNCCFFSCCFTSANYKVLIHSCETWRDVILVWMILMFKKSLEALWNGCFPQIPYFEPRFLKVQNQIMTTRWNNHIHNRIIYLINMMYYCLRISIFLL